MSNILRGLNEGRNYGRDSWDSNMPGYQGDYGGAENFGRRNREWDEDDRIDARIRAENEKKREYEQNGKFWLKFKDSQRHLPAGPFIGKQAANTAAIELLKQQPELKGNLLITAYGPDETQGVAEGYSNTTFNVDRRKLNVPALIQKGAILVTHPHGEQGWETDNKEDWAFSLLSLYNVLQGGWASEAKKYLKPESYKRAEQQINSSAPNLGSDKLVYDGKYNQIMWSIKKLGIPDKIAFLDKDKQGVAEGQLDELSNNTLASYKKKAGADATQADKRGDYARGNKRMSGIVKATKKEFDNDAKGVEEGRYDSGDYYNARQGYEYGARSPSVDSGGYEFDKEVQRNEPGGDRGRPKNTKGVSTSLPADAFGRTTGKIPAGKTGRIHSMMGDIDEELDENLHKWFKEKWVRFGPDGKIRGDCARGDDSEGKPKCLPQSKAQNLGKEGRASAASRKRREDPNPERSGKAINVNTKKKSNEGVAEAEIDRPGMKDGRPYSDPYRRHPGNSSYMTPAYMLDQYKKRLAQIAAGPYKRPKEVAQLQSRIAKLEKQGVAEEQLDEKCWDTHKQVGMKNKGGKQVPNCVPKESIEESRESCPECGGPMFSDMLLAEKQDACYNKVKSRYKVWPSAYASGALVQCRKKGADSWGNGGKKNEGVAEEVNPEVTSDDYTEPSQNVRMGDFVFNARTFTGALGEPNAKGLQIRAYEPKNLKSSIGSADFIVKKDKKGNQWLESDDTEVNDEYRGKGVATMMYAFAKSLGNDIKDSPYKSKAGSDMWKKWGSDAKHLVGEQGVAEDQLDEKWTKKYKDSINCSNPKGFSQKAHCAGKKKSESAIMRGLVDETLGTPYPGTYEQEMEPFKRKGQQQRVQKIAFEGKK